MSESEAQRLARQLERDSGYEPSRIGNCGHCRQPLTYEACASSEHKRIATDIELGVRRPDGTLPPRRRSSNRRSESERDAIRRGRQTEKRILQGRKKTSLDGRGQTATSRFLDPNLAEQRHNAARRPFLK